MELTDETVAELGHVDHLVHCSAIYDVTAGEAEQHAANVEGTRAVIALALRLGTTVHHVSSIAVAGDFRGEYTEDDFDVGQQLPSPYHQTKFEAKLLVRSTPGLRYLIYRPAVVVGDSRTGEMDKIDGPYYFFGVLAKPCAAPVLKVPEFACYAPRLWRYWAEHLDPDRVRRDDPAGALRGMHAIITGASSGIGRASAIAVAERGATVFAFRATVPRSTSWSPRSVPAAVRHTRSPIRCRWSTPSRTSWAGSVTSTTW